MSAMKMSGLMSKIVVQSSKWKMERLGTEVKKMKAANLKHIVKTLVQFELMTSVM